MLDKTKDTERIEVLRKNIRYYDRKYYDRKSNIQIFQAAKKPPQDELGS